MWYIFPQIDGLAFSSTSTLLDQEPGGGKAYTRSRCSRTEATGLRRGRRPRRGRSAAEIFGSPDDLKLRSCDPFRVRAALGVVFDRLLVKYYRGGRDERRSGCWASTPALGRRGEVPEGLAWRPAVGRP